MDSLAPACKNVLTILKGKGAFFFLWSYHPVIGVTTTTGRKLAAPHHLQNSPAFMPIKPPPISWFGKLVIKPTYNRVDWVLFSDTFFLMRMGFSWDWNKTEDKTRLCPPQVEETPCALQRRSSLFCRPSFFFFFNRKDVSLGVYEAHLPNLGILCIKYGGNFC